MKDNKVFCIGFAKTGTTALKKALGDMGYRVAGYNQFRHFAQEDNVTYDAVLAHALQVMGEFDACQDSPWPILFKDLDQAFPGSKFIHVIRDSDAWLKSALSDFSGHPNPLRQIIYGSLYPEGNEIEWLSRYEQHNEDAARYFANRPDDYLQLRLEDLDFKRICDFLGEEYTGQSLPVTNTRLQKKLKKLFWRLTGKR